MNTHENYMQQIRNSIDANLKTLCIELESRKVHGITPEGIFKALVRRMNETIQIDNASIVVENMVKAAAIKKIIEIL